MTSLLRILIACLTALAVVAPAAGAQSSTNAPPGNSGVDQYLETVPDASGGKPANQRRSGGAQLPAKVRQRLEQAGPEGRKVLELTESTAPKGAIKATGKKRADRSGARKDRGDDDKAAPAATGSDSGGGKSGGVGAAVSSAVTGSGDGGMGWLLPALLIASAAVVIGVGIGRRRRA